MGKQLVYVEDKNKYLWEEVEKSTSTFKIVRSHDITRDIGSYSQSSEEGFTYIWLIYFFVPLFILVFALFTHQH